MDDLKSSRSIKGTHGPDFELLDARIASALNKIIQKTRFRKKVRNTSGSLGPMILSRIMLSYLQLFFKMTISKSSKQNGMISFVDDANPIWWHLGNLNKFKNTSVWEAQDRVGIVQYWGSFKESRTQLSQNEDDGKKKYRAEFEDEETLKPEMEDFETSAVVKNQGTKQREQGNLGRLLEMEKLTRQCSKGDNCSFRHDQDKRAKSTQQNLSPGSSTQ